jgi:hypothetical protein
MDGVKPKTPSALVRLPGVHEQEDGTILAVCATGTSSRYANVSKQCCLSGSVIRCLCDSQILDRLFSGSQILDPGSHIFESLVTIFW